MIYTACGEFVEQYSHSLDPLPTQTGSLDDVHFNYLKYTLDFAQQNTYQELREGEFYSPDNTLLWKLYDLKRANEDTKFIFAKDLEYATFGSLSAHINPLEQMITITPLGLY